MLNDKAVAAVAFMEIARADRDHTNACSTPYEDCNECQSHSVRLESLMEMYEATEGEAASCRERLENKSQGYVQKLNVGGHNVYVRTGEYEDGRLGGVRLDIHKQGAAFRGLMSCFADAVSLGLQHGVPLQLFVNKFVGTCFEPSGIISEEHRPGIGKVTSLMDAIFKDLALSYGAEIPKTTMAANI